jgi:hypothetical protein
MHRRLPIRHRAEIKRCFLEKLLGPVVGPDRIGGAKYQHDEQYVTKHGRSPLAWEYQTFKFSALAKKA